jgi:hypothetical protein
MDEKKLKEKYLEWLHKGRDLFDQIGYIITLLGDPQDVWAKYKRSSYGWQEYIIQRGDESSGLTARILYVTVMVGEKTLEPIVNKAISIRVGGQWVMWMYKDGLPISAAMYGDRVEVFLDGPWLEPFLELEQEIDKDLKDVVEMAIARRDKSYMLGLLRDGIIPAPEPDKQNAKVIPG